MSFKEIVFGKIILVKNMFIIQISFICGAFLIAELKAIASIGNFKKCFIPNTIYDGLSKETALLRYG